MRIWRWLGIWLMFVAVCGTATRSCFLLSEITQYADTAERISRGGQWAVSPVSDLLEILTVVIIFGSVAGIGAWFFWLGRATGHGRSSASVAVGLMIWWWVLAAVHLISGIGGGLVGKPSLPRTPAEDTELLVALAVPALLVSGVAAALIAQWVGPSFSRRQIAGVVAIGLLLGVAAPAGTHTWYVYSLDRSSREAATESGRAEALRSLGHTNSRLATSLVRRPARAEGPLAAAALRALARLPGGHEELVAIADDANVAPAVRVLAVAASWHGYGSLPAMLPAAQRLLDHSDPRIRRETLKVFYFNGHTEVFASRLDDPDVNVRVTACIGVFRSDRGRATVLELLDELVLHHEAFDPDMARCVLYYAGFSRDVLPLEGAYARAMVGLEVFLASASGTPEEREEAARAVKRLHGEELPDNAPEGCKWR